MSAEHTPGPWHIGSEHDRPGLMPGEGALVTEYRYDGGADNADGSRGWPYFVGVNETRIGRTDHHVASEIQSLDDARLISAAPDLLKAAKRALAVLKAQGESVRPGNVLGALAEAIAKAGDQ